MIDDITIHHVCAQAGVEYVGEQDVPGGEQLVLFTDLLTRSTLALERKNFTSPKVQAKITKHRRQFPKDIEMTAYFIDALDFIVRKYHAVPKAVIVNAAHSAGIVIQQFIAEQNEIARHKETPAH